MKKLILLCFVTIISISISAQIELYSGKKVDDQKKIDKIPTLLETKDSLLNKYLIKKEPHLFSSFAYSRAGNYKADVYLIGDTLYSLPGENGDNVYCLSSVGDTISVQKFPIGEYFYVKDIVPIELIDTLLFDRFSTMTFVCDTFYNAAYPKGWFTISKEVCDPNIEYAKVPVWKYFLSKYFYGTKKTHTRISKDIVYVLENSGVEFYITKERYYLCPPDNKKNARRIYTPQLEDFISLKSFNFIKNKYAGKEVCAYHSFSTDFSGKPYDFYSEKKVYKVEKVIVKDKQLHIQVISNVNNEVVLFPIESIFRNYIENSRKDTIEVLDVQNFYIEGYEYYGFCLKTDVDSLHAKLQYEYEQKQLALQRKQTQYKEELIKKYGKQYGSLIADGKICVGMTKEMCMAAKGSPCKKSTHTDRYDTTEVWTYHCNSSFYYPIYVTFTNNKVTSITDL